MIPFSLPSLDVDAKKRALARQAELTKPPGSLGRLESLACQLASIQGSERPSARPALVVLFGADHPVTAHGISPYPSAVTLAMMKNFVHGGAAASVLSRRLGLPLHIVDVGVDDGQHFETKTELTTFERRPSAAIPEADIVFSDAQNEADFAASVESGRAVIRARSEGLVVLLLGEMGIGNTTVAAAVAAKILKLADPGTLVGRGTGADDAMLEAKRRVVRNAVARVAGDVTAEEALRRLGGRELFALYGAMLEAIERRVAILVDGFIVSTVALAVASSHPGAEEFFVFAHEGSEHGHKVVLEALGVRPLLSLELRLGEASGALAAFPLLESAVEVHSRMATFSEAAVPDRGE